MQKLLIDRITKLVFVTFFTVALVGCFDGNSKSNSSLPTVSAVYSAAEGIEGLPFPNAIYSNAAGRLSLPLAAGVSASDLSKASVAMNTLDGFSTIAPIRQQFTGDIDGDSIEGGVNVRLFEVTADAQQNPTGIIQELSSGLDYQAVLSAVDASVVLVKPLIPLTASSHYMVAYTNNLRGASGEETIQSDDYADLLDGTSINGDGIDGARLALLVEAQADLLATVDIEAASLLSSVSFATHSTSNVLDTINEAATAQTISLLRPTMTISGVTSGLTSEPLSALLTTFGLTPGGQSDIFTGLIALPYYMTIPASPTDSSGRDGFLQDAVGAAILGNNVPQSQSLTVPVMVTIPNPSLDATLIKPATGWPVAIYHHGITGNRANVLLIADALSARGVAMIAIDQSVHGVVPIDATELPLSIFADAGVSFYDAANERHFNFDLDGDGIIDRAGANFSSPNNLLTSRDNLRQSVSDLIYLAKTIPTITLPGDVSLAFDSDKIHYVSLSLGSIVGSMLAGVNTDIKAFSLSAPGAGGVKFSEGAPNGNAGVIAALADLGLTQGSQAYENHLTLLTTIQGSGDPINYGISASNKHPIHLTEIIGDGTIDNLPDQTIANEVLNNGQYAGLVAETAPLAGTEPLVRAMHLTDVFRTVSNSGGLRAIVRLLQGDHQSQVNPIPAPQITREIHLQTASFIASGGTDIEVGDASLLEDNYFPAQP